MTDPRPRRRPSPRGRDAPHVWICTFEHRDGIDVCACTSEEAAYHELAKVCREFWEEAREVDRSLVPCKEGPTPATPPEDDRAAVEAYFAAMSCDDPPEAFLIAAHEVIGTSRGEGR
jgi:hypothetical protein